jgi:WD40 repeat protein
MDYNAFISYSHAADGNLAPALQSALHRFAKPWYRLRALRVFRDKTSLSANPSLWPAIEEALSQSEFFLLMASPEAAGSRWVQQEVAWWLQGPRRANLLIVLSEGELIWDERAQDFDWARTTALPGSLRGVLRHEPLYVDLRWARTENSLSLRHSRFRAAVLDLAAKLHHKPKDQLDGEDVREQRRNLYWLSGALVTIAGFAVLASWQALVANERRVDAEQARAAEAHERRRAEAAAKEATTRRKEAEQQRKVAERRRREAERQRNIALSRGLAAQAELSRTSPDIDSLPTSALLAAQSLQRVPTIEAGQTMQAVVSLLPSQLHRIPHAASLTAVAYDSSGGHLATAATDGSVSIWEVLRDKTALVDRIANQDQRWVARALAMSRGAERIAMLVVDSRTYRVARLGVWDRRGGKLLMLSASFFNPEATVALTADGRYAVAATDSYTLNIWEVDTGRELPSLGVAGTVSGFRNHFVLAPKAEYAAELTGREIRLRKLPDGEVLWSFDTGLDIEYASFSRDARFLLIASGGVVRILDLDPKDWVTEFFRGTDEPPSTGRGPPKVIDQVLLVPLPSAMVFDPVHRNIAGIRTNSASVWDIVDGRELIRVTANGQITGIAPSPDGTSLATASGDRTAAVWGIPLADRATTFAFVHDKLVAAPRGVYLVQGVGSNVATVIDVDARRVVQRAEVDQPIGAIAMSPDGELLATASRSKLSIWNVSTGKREASAVHSDDVLGLAFHPAQPLLAVADAKAVALWDFGTGRISERVVYTQESRDPGLSSPETWRRSDTLGARTDWADLRFSEGGRRLWMSRQNHAAHYLFDFGPGNVLRLADASSRRSPVDGRRLAAEDGNRWRIEDFETDRLILTIPDDKQQPLRLSFTPDGRWFARTVRNYAEIRSGRNGKLLSRFPHNSGIAPGISADGKYLVTADTKHGVTAPEASTVVRVWRVADAKEIARISEAGFVSTVSFTPNGRFVMIRGASIKLWRWRLEDLVAAACTRLSRDLSETEWRTYVGDEPYRKTCSVASPAMRVMTQVPRHRPY